jgi:hypothetical protein
MSCDGVCRWEANDPATDRCSSPSNESRVPGSPSAPMVGAAITHEGIPHLGDSGLWMCRRSGGCAVSDNGCEAISESSFWIGPGLRALRDSAAARTSVRGMSATQRALAIGPASWPAPHALSKKETACFPIRKEGGWRILTGETRRAQPRRSLSEQQFEPELNLARRIRLCGDHAEVE